MTYKKTLVILLALLLAGMVVAPVVSAGEQSTQSAVYNGQITNVTTSEAAAIAELNVKDLAITVPDFSEWNRSSVHLAKTYFDLNDQPTAYAFEIVVDGKYDGYILISANTGNYPVLEVTKGTIPGTEATAISKSQQAADTIASEDHLTVTDSKPVYLGSLSYYRKYSTTNRSGQKDRDIFMDEHSGTIMKSIQKSANETTPANTAEYKQLQVQKKADIQAQWDKQRLLLSGESAERTALLNSIQATRSSNYVYGVPYFIQDSTYNGCSPMSGAMIVSFWSTHGYSALPSARETLFTQLANEMGTGSSWPLDGSTWPWRIAPGISRVFYTYTSLTPASNDYLPGWSGFVSEINSGRPFELSMRNGGTSVGGSQPYGQHSVAVVGYVSSINNFITIHDTWDASNDRLLQDNSWSNIMATWVRP